MFTDQPPVIQTPVCIADLPGYDFAVTPDTPTEIVVAALEKQPSLPGVMLVEAEKLLGSLSRLKLFERLRHRFEREAFLLKPIRYFKGTSHLRFQPLPGNLSVEEAIRYAFSRPALDIYDPLVTVDRNSSIQMLDMNFLLQVQARAMASLSNVSANLAQIDRLIETGWDCSEIFAEIILLLRQAVPYHQAAILKNDGIGLRVVAQAGHPQIGERADTILASPVYEILAKHRRALHVQNTGTVPIWKGMEALGNPASWLGLPIVAENRLVGILSISRNMERPFSSEEREITLTYAQKISGLLDLERAVPELVLVPNISQRTGIEEEKQENLLTRKLAFTFLPALAENAITG